MGLAGGIQEFGYMCNSLPHFGTEFYTEARFKERVFYDNIVKSRSYKQWYIWRGNCIVSREGIEFEAGRLKSEPRASIRKLEGAIQCFAVIPTWLEWMPQGER